MRMGRTTQIALYSGLAGLLSIISTGCSTAAKSATAKRVIVLGIDGMDPNYLDRHWAALPQLDRLRREGEFKHLETVMPPQSPVAWSTFITGLDPGGHGIFDFIHRDPQTMAPFSSMAQTAEGGSTIPVGPYDLPLKSGKVVSFRKGKPFWQMLSENHIPVNILRMPTDFPPVHCEQGFSIAGMGTPDLRGTFGTFAFYTDAATEKSRAVPGGQIVRVNLPRHTALLRIQGPDYSLR
jgi:predicted AlkP superfamily phosphohydrolase/phosphomutase